jgi:hypothetical protein
MSPYTNIAFYPDKAEAIISGDSVLTDVAFAIEAVCSNFLGRGAYRFELTRQKRDNGNCVLEAKALVESGPVKMSKVASVIAAASQGVFPFTLDSDFKKSEPGIVSEGQHQYFGFYGRKDKDSATTVIETRDLEPNTPMSMISYGLADMFTGFYALGVKYLKWQGSLGQTQLYLRHNLTDQQIREYLLSTKDYEVQQLVSKLP